MSNSQHTTTVAIEHNGHGDVVLTVGTQAVARFCGERKYPRVRRPFWEYSAEAALWGRRGTRKVSGKYVVDFAAGLGMPRAEALRVVNEALAYLGWPAATEEHK